MSMTSSKTYSFINGPIRTLLVRVTKFVSATRQTTELPYWECVPMETVQCLSQLA